MSQLAGANNPSTVGMFIFM